MSVTVCPSGFAAAPADGVWQVLTTPERFGDWQDARVVAVRPSGPVVAGQQVDLTAGWLGIRLPVRIDVDAVDQHRRWLQLRVHLPLGIVNYERVTLTETAPDRTLVRFN
jgi:ligand-binding SRPBCC domain-containing protein